MKLSRDDALNMALDFDNLVRQGMTIAEQIDFLIDNRTHLDRTYHTGELEWWDPSGEQLVRGFYPLSILFGASAFAWNIYQPENLVGLSTKQLATLAMLLAKLTDTHIQSCNATAFIRCQAIVEATHILPRVTRALFCAIQMRGYRWTEDRRIFVNRYKQMYYQALTNGSPIPEYPRDFCKRRFYDKFSSSYASKLPQTLVDAIAADNPAQFSIMLTMSNRQLAKNLLLHLINASALNILLANFDAVKRFLPIDTLVFYCASSLDQHLASPLLRQIEKSSPGTLRNSQDIFGNNAFWYLLYREENLGGRPWQNDIVAPIEPIEALLLKHGCNPDQPNCLDLTYSSIVTAQKELNNANTVIG